jgi:N-acetylglucosamine kinase-like BadF-type ATPase
MKVEPFLIVSTVNIKGESTSNLANYHNIGIDKAITSVYTAASYAIRLAKIKISDIAATCVGIAAYDTPKDKVIITTAIQKAQHQFLGKNVKIVNDSVIGLFTGTKPPGVCLISGTGCNCYGVGPKGKEWFAGNWSYLMGDQGGGYHLALRIFRAVIKAFDGRGEPTILRELVLDQLGITDEFALESEKKPKPKNHSITESLKSAISTITRTSAPPKTTVEQIKDKWTELISSISAQNYSLTFILSMVNLTAVDGEGLHLTFPYSLHKEKIHPIANRNGV